MSSFVRISPHVLLRSPPPGTKPRKLTDPAAILLLGWFFPDLKHLENYSDVYKKLFPASPVLVVVPPYTAFFRASTTLHTTLLPAYHALKSLIPLHSSSIHILSHTFSNGGLLSHKILDELARTDIELGGRGLPISKMIVDSAPNTEVGRRLAGEIFKHKDWSSPGSVAVAGSYAAISLLSGATGLPTPITTLSSYYVSSFPHVPRLYLYSDIDDLIPPTEIESHIRQFREAGGDAREVKFVGTDHVGHVVGKKNAERYWKNVREFWESGGDEGRVKARL